MKSNTVWNQENAMNTQLNDQGTDRELSDSELDPSREACSGWASLSASPWPQEPRL